MPDSLTIATLREFIINHFSLEEIRTLCVDCGVDYEELPHHHKGPLVRELLLETKRLGKLFKLVHLVKKHRPVLFVEQFGEESSFVLLETEAKLTSATTSVPKINELKKGLRIEELNFFGCSAHGITLFFGISFLICSLSYLIIANPKLLASIFPEPTASMIPPSREISTPILILVITPTPTNIPQPVVTSPTLTVTPTHTPTPTLTPPHTPIPTSTGIFTRSPIFGTVTVANLNVRWGPNSAYGYIGALREGDQVIVLGRTLDGFWLEIETPEDKKGWVAAQYISILPPGDTTSIAIVPTPPLPSPPPVTPLPSDELPELTLRGPSVFGELDPQEEAVYHFLEDQKETAFVLMFQPNVNTNSTDQVQFVIYQDQVGASTVVGVGSHPTSDRDAYLDTGELIWRGGPLVSGMSYYLRILNYSSEIIQYCLATSDIYEWRCPKN